MVHESGTTVALPDGWATKNAGAEKKSGQWSPLFHGAAWVCRMWVGGRPHANPRHMHRYQPQEGMGSFNAETAFHDRTLQDE